MYDKYRKVFYRFALMPDDNIKPFSNNPHQSFSIIILNKDYEIIGETKFPGNTYAHHLCFVGKKACIFQRIMKTILSLTKTNWYSGVSHFKAEKMKKKNYSIILCGGLFLASCMSNNDKCLQNCLMKSELRNHKSTMPPTLLPYWVMVAKDAYTKLCQKYITRPILFI